MPNPPPAPVPIPAPVPRLPPPPPDDEVEPAPGMTPLSPSFPKSPSHPPPPTHALRMVEKDIQATAKFTREFVVMSLIPWMEHCVASWNENVRTCLNSVTRSHDSNFRAVHKYTKTPFSAVLVNPSPLRQYTRLFTRSSTFTCAEFNGALSIKYFATVSNDDEHTTASTTKTRRVLHHSG